MSKKLEQLINEYIECSNYVFSILKKHYSVEIDQIFKSRRLKIIPKDGKIENMYFNFHGGGCYFKLENDVIDVDFGPNGRIDGFDLMRLAQFLSMRKNRYPEFVDEIELEKAFNQLEHKQVIVKPALFPGPHLYYLKSNFK